MKNLFSLDKNHYISEANVNFYASPFIHPCRKMNAHDFIYLMQGEWKIKQNDTIYELKKDTILILGANQNHQGVSPCSPETKTMYFHVAPNNGDCIMDQGQSSADQLSIDTLIDVSANKKIKKIFSEIVQCKLSNNQRKADLYFELLLCELAEHRQDEDLGVATKIKSIIHSHPEKFFSNKELAEAANVSVKTAENKFKALLGKTIHQYTLDFKIKEAISYFEFFPEISIKEIAYNLGFYDEYHFSKQFKKTIGLSPREYKKNVIN